MPSTRRGKRAAASSPVPEAEPEAPPNAQPGPERGEASNSQQGRTTENITLFSRLAEPLARATALWARALARGRGHLCRLLALMTFSRTERGNLRSNLRVGLFVALASRSESEALSKIAKLFRERLGNKGYSSPRSLHLRSAASSGNTLANVSFPPVLMRHFHHRRRFYQQVGQVRSPEC